MNESEKLAERIALCLPGATFEMEALCQLIGISASREIESAAVAGGERPKMLINPDFVARFCSRDEHLFLLVMHELWHILLAHTRLFPRATLIDNIAFDAVINAGLSLQFPEAEYRGFFEAINPPDVFPNLLLRPPVGWPDQPIYPPDNPLGTRGILERLYFPDTQGGKFAEPLYEEIRDLLNQSTDINQAQVQLLGNHVDQEEAVMRDRYTREVIQKIVEAWPPPPIPLKGRSSGGNSGSWTSLIGQANQSARREFARLLRRYLKPSAGHHQKRQRGVITTMSGTGVLPNPRDRLRTARQKLGVSDLLWQQPVETRVRIHQGAQSHLYFDVSGSMFSRLPGLIGLILPYVARGEVQVFQFSGVVEPLSLADLRRGELETSRGTDINCVLEHLFVHKIRRALLLTDGCTGVPRDDHARRLKSTKVQLHVVMPHESSWIEDLQDIAASMTVLPPLDA